MLVVPLLNAEDEDRPGGCLGAVVHGPPPGVRRAVRRQIRSAPGDRERRVELSLVAAALSGSHRRCASRSCPPCLVFAGMVAEYTVTVPTPAAPVGHDWSPRPDGCRRSRNGHRVLGHHSREHHSRIGQLSEQPGFRDAGGRRWLPDPGQRQPSSARFVVCDLRERNESAGERLDERQRVEGRVPRFPDRPLDGLRPLRSVTAPRAR